MWALINETAFAADRTWVRDRDGNHQWVVAVKATYALSDTGELRLADEQLPPLIEPEYFAAPGESSVRFDVDLVEPKPTTDVLLNASAYAPGGRPAPTVEASLVVLGARKTLLIHGPRVYARSPTGVAASSPRPFTHQPIRYESAFGGSDRADPDPRRHRIDLRNPVGRGVAAHPASLVDRPAHSVEYPGDNHVPAGFGALASHWSPRRELAGTFDEHSCRPPCPTSAGAARRPGATRSR
jgi:hypothetical protein